MLKTLQIVDRSQVITVFATFESMISCSAQMPNLRQACCIIAEHHVTYCRPTEQVARYHAFIDGHSA